MEKALKNLDLRLPQTGWGDWNHGNKMPAWRRCFEIVESMPGACRKFNFIANERDVEQLKDMLTEIKYAVIFAQLGFDVKLEPLSDQQSALANPDLRISRNGYSSIVEVKRFRASHKYSPGERLQKLPKEVPETYTFPSIGDPIKDPQKTLNEIENKFRQAGKDGIIAVWNNTEELSPFEVATAVNRLKSNSNHPKKSSFVLLRGDAYEKFSCFELRDELTPHLREWMNELEQVTPDNILRRISNKS